MSLAAGGKPAIDLLRDVPVFAGLDEDGDYVIDDDATKIREGVRAGEVELETWLTPTLDLGPTRTGLLATAMYDAGLTRERMVAAAKLPGGFQVLCDQLAAVGELRLRPGDRMALAAAAMQAGQE